MGYYPIFFTESEAEKFRTVPWLARERIPEPGLEIRHPAIVFSQCSMALSSSCLLWETHRAVAMQDVVPRVASWLPTALLSLT